MRKVIWAIALSIVAGVLFAVIYPAVRGEAARSPKDKLGETIGTILIPAVFIGAYSAGIYLETRRKHTKL